MEKIDLQTAKELSILKWEYLSNTGQPNLKKSTLEDDLGQLLSHCGICEYQGQRNNLSGLCLDCVLNTKHRKRYQYVHNVCCGGLFKKWQCALLKSTRKKYAKMILNLIKSINV